MGFIRALVEKLKNEKNWFARTKDQTFEKIEKLIEAVEIELKVSEAGSITLKRSQSKAVSNVKDSMIALLQAMGTGIIIIDVITCFVEWNYKE